MSDLDQSTNPDAPYRVAFSHVTGIGPARMTALERRFETLAHAWSADRTMLREAGLDGRTVDEFESTRATLDPFEAYERMLDAGVNALTVEDDGYPRRLREIADPPPLLYVKGELAERDEWSIAIVGTRRPTAYGRQVTSSLAGELADSGLTIVSGLARGVDGIAHETALERGARTVAVVASGLDRVYPPEHQGLAAQILESGGACPAGTR